MQNNLNLLWGYFRSSLNRLAYYGISKKKWTLACSCSVMVFTLLLGHAGITLGGESMKLSENDTGKTVEMLVGDELEVALPGKPTMGYVWDVTSVDTNILKLCDADFIKNNEAIGSGGLEVIRFHALAVGTSEVKLILHRSFEQNTPPLKTFELTVIVKQ